MNEQGWGIRDLAFYGSAAWVAIFLAFVAMRSLDHVLVARGRWRYSLRGLFVAMTFAAIVLGVLTVVFKR